MSQGHTPVIVPPAGTATYKRMLRKETLRRNVPHEANFLNITAMLDMMTIILVFLLKSMSSSNSVPQSNDLKLPASVLTTEASQEGLPILITKKGIIVGENEVVPVPPDASNGVDAQYKKNGANDLYITKLGTALSGFRETDKAIRTASGKDPNSSEAIIVADENTPYRLLCEVLYTLGQNEFAKFHLMVNQGAKQ
jgi:biopolymer transport protein ExbD